MANNFRVIVVGTGLVGLTAAHALRLAGIDFVVLERRECVLTETGASIGFSPSTLRVLAQFGILDAVRAIGADFTRIKSFDMTGHKFADNTSPEVTVTNHGAPLMVFHRAELLKALYNGLPPSSKAKIFTGKTILSLNSSDTCASVTCDDGTTYTGSIVLGADGAHSQTRRLMRKLALAADPAKADWDDESPYRAEYRCMWTSFPLRGDPAGLVTDTQARDRSLMYLSTKERGSVFLYERLPAATSKRARYTEKDMAAMAARFSDVLVTETLKVRDVLDMETAGMADLEEGVIGKWSWGRVALVGDACHKVTPNAGRGYTTGVQDVVAVANRLVIALQASPDGTLDTATLAELFEDYHATQVEGIAVEISFSRHATRLQAWANTAYYCVARYVMCWGFVHRCIHNWVNGPQMAQGLVLDYVPMEEPFAGSMPWKHPMMRPLAKGGKQRPAV